MFTTSPNMVSGSMFVLAVLTLYCTRYKKFKDDFVEGEGHILFTIEIAMEHSHGPVGALTIEA